MSTRYLVGVKEQNNIREMVNRIARLDAAEAWSGDLNPSQRSVLEYLSRANMFSRSPSHIAEYFGTTKGTISQTLKSLKGKGYVSGTRSATDKRAISYELTAQGHGAVAQNSSLADGLLDLQDCERIALSEALSAVLKRILDKNDGRPFGVCRTCKHFSPRAKGGFCALLSQPLTQADITQICNEQAPV
jgi:DNA-binding MarR family transcriptional regulator